MDFADGICLNCGNFSNKEKHLRFTFSCFIQTGSLNHIVWEENSLQQYYIEK